MLAIRCGLTKEQEKDLKENCNVYHERESHGNVYNADFCCARMWNGGFGGQCGRPTQWNVGCSRLNLASDTPETAFLDEEGQLGGLCQRHFNILEKKGALPHGLYSEDPPEGHAWKWLSPGKKDRFGYYSKEDAIQNIADEKKFARESGLAIVAAKSEK
tara:strand:- start:9323 stop:9799 length:477 start_codon:yes stop_codon:yes gene_type:complete